VFDNLSQRLGDIFKKLRGQGHLSEANMEAGLREIRLALLEADVQFQVAKEFLKKVKTKALGQEVLQSLTPGQQVVKIVQDEMTDLLGGEHQDLRISSHPPTVVLMIGLQGSGKTTTAAKLARHLRGRGRSPLLVPADLARPAAVEQLRRLGSVAGVVVHDTQPGQRPLDVARAGVKDARDRGHDVVLIDTAGRLHVDDELMAELREMKTALEPTEILYVADAMTGQDAVTSASRFHEEVGLTGVILSKLDGDARGGAALSVRAVTGVPIRFAGVGEKVDDLEAFHPERMASRILGMGDVMTLIEKAQAVTRDQLRKVQQLGPLDQLMKLLPGAGQAALPEMEGDELKRTEAIINSMTAKERHDHTVINGSRRRRIARGSGTTVQDVNRLLKQFAMLHRFMKKAGGRLDERALKRMRF